MNITVKEIQKNIIELFFDKFLESFVGQDLSIKNEKITKLADIRFSNGNLKLDSYIKFSDVLKNENKNLYKELKSSLLKTQNGYFFSPQYTLSMKFFSFITNKENIGELWDLLDIKHKRKLFDDLISKMKGERAPFILDKIKPEEYSYLFRLTFKREAEYLDKEPFTFAEKIENLQKALDDNSLITLLKNLYQNINNTERNVLTSFVKDEKCILLDSIKNNLDFDFIIEKNQITNLVDNIDELFAVNYSKNEEINFFYEFDKNVISKLVGDLLPKENIHQLFNYVLVQFNHNGYEFNVSNKLNPLNKENYLTNNHRISFKITNKDGFSEAQKEELCLMTKLWFLKIINEDILNIISSDKTNYKKITPELANQKMEVIRKELREKELFLKLNNENIIVNNRNKSKI